MNNPFQEYKIEGSPPINGPNYVNERQFLIQTAVDRINKDRKGTKWKEVTWGQINGKVAHLKGFELGWFIRECEKADNFSRMFFGKLKSVGPDQRQAGFKKKWTSK